MAQEGDDRLKGGKFFSWGHCDVSLSHPHLRSGDALHEVANLIVVRDVFLVLRKDLIFFDLPVRKNFKRIVWELLFLISLLKNSVVIFVLLFIVGTTLVTLDEFD